MDNIPTLGRKKVDAHMHLGTDKYWKPASHWNVYAANAAAQNIVHSVAAPVPCPVNLMGFQTVCPSVWEFKEGEFEDGNHTPYYKKFITLGNHTTSFDSNQNPYSITNERLLKFSQGEPFSVTPLHHPKLDDPNYVCSLLSKKEVVGLKVHTIASYTSDPEMIHPEVIEKLKNTRKPLVVHTDYLQREAANPLEWITKQANPIKWIKFALEHDLRMYLPHGARANEDAIRLANDVQNYRTGLSQIMIGLSPSLLLTSKGEREKLVNSDYLRTVIKNANHKILASDTDYSWNVPDRNSTELEWEEFERVEAVMDEVGYTEEEKKSVFYSNAKEFFGLPIPAI
jgi:hypothetical protein